MTSLSNSTLWQSMHDYYNQIGPEAWTDEIVPLQITSNTLLAKLYAQLIIAQINDFIAQNGNQPAAEPFHIIEIGAGHGKFSFYLLKMLCAALDAYNLPKNSFLYIMSDISEKNIESWRQHPALKPYVAKNILDFAYYNALTDSQIKLSNQTINIGQLSKPLFVICNYLFDTLPHDAFQVIDNKLHETELFIKNKANVSSDSLTNYFENIAYSFKQNPITEAYYDNKTINKILAYYQEHFENASFVIPVGGIQFLDKIRKFTNSHMMLLIADKGVAEPSLFGSLEDNPDITLHGSVSMTVNFDAIARYVDLHQGISLLMPNKSADFQIACFILNAVFPVPHTKFAYDSLLSAFSLFDLFNLCYKDDEPNKAFATIEDLLAILNLAQWDPTIFYDYHPILLEKTEQNDITAEQKFTLIAGLDKVWDHFFKLEKTQDIPFAIGILLYNMDEPEKALQFYEYSLEHFGEQEETWYNKALTYQQLDDRDNAILANNKALTLNSTYTPATELLKEYVE